MWHWGTAVEKPSFPMEYRMKKIRERIEELQRMMSKCYSAVRKRNIGRKLHNCHAQLKYWEVQKLAWLLAQP